MTVSMFWSEHDMIVRAPPISSTAISNGTLALGERHREELALLAGDEHAVDAEIVDPVPQVAAEAGLVDRQVGH